MAMPSAAEVETNLETNEAKLAVQTAAKDSLAEAQNDVNALRPGEPEEPGTETPTPPPA
jgi:hypothetical protein